MEKQRWINALRDAANKYRVAAPVHLFNPNYCPLCSLAQELEDDWETRCNSCIFHTVTCTKQASFINAKEAFRGLTFFLEDVIEDNTQDLLLIRAEELDNLADNLETVPYEWFPEWIENLNIETNE